MLIKNPHKTCFFTHEQIRNGRIDSNQILHINSLGDDIWHDIEIGWGVSEGRGCENGPLPLTLALAKAYCATAQTRDYLHTYVVHKTMQMSQKLFQ